MPHLDDTPTHDPPPSKVRYRVPMGLPLRDDGRRAGAVVSVLLHALIVALLVLPFMLPGPAIERMQQGAGGEGPAGGGGGGRGGTGGTRESLRFVRLAPDPVPTPKALPPTPKPAVPKVELPKPKPVETPPAKAPEQQQSAVPAPQLTVAAALPGANGGSGRDGSSGAGPGSGGGVGSGVGTGRGSATGPGTGGGTQANYPPQVLNMSLPPLPPPASVHGWTMRANFDVDSTGRVLDFKVNDSPDRSYNRQIASILRTYKFRPGTRPDGTPLRMTAQISIDF